ncbi:MAG TPA: hypothetical protein ENN66_09705 [Proteobacteria bacterium]|nr:hypothetical protein [Pseudomonadota bacterium]
MPCEKPTKRWLGAATAARTYIVIALGWLVIISLLHHQFNGEQEDRRIIRMGYMPVLSNLAAPLLDHASRKNGDYRFLAIKFASFAEIAEGLRNDHLDAAFIIAPLALVLRQQGEKVRIVCIGNRQESTLVTRVGSNIGRIEDLAGKTLAVPSRYSGHYLEMLHLMETRALNPAIQIVEMNPPDMASALTSAALDAYFVGEPFAAQTIRSGKARALLYVEELRPHFICNLVLVKQAWLEREPRVVQALVSGVARAGIWAGKHSAEAARIASRYWKQPPELIEYALSTPTTRIEFDRFTPDSAEIQALAELMTSHGLLEHSETTGLVADSFAQAVDLNNLSDCKSILGH